MAEQGFFRKKSQLAAEDVGVPPVPTPAAARVAARGKGNGGVQVNLHLPPDVHRRLKLASVRRDQTLAEVLAGLVAEHLPPE